MSTSHNMTENLLLMEGGYPHLPAIEQEPVKPVKTESKEYGKPYGYVVKNADSTETFHKELPELIDQLSVTPVYIPLANATAIGTVRVYRAPSHSHGIQETEPYITVSWLGKTPSHGDMVYTIEPTLVEVK